MYALLPNRGLFWNLSDMLHYLCNNIYSIKKCENFWGAGKISNSQTNGRNKGLANTVIIVLFEE